MPLSSSLRLIGLPVVPRLRLVGLPPVAIVAELEALWPGVSSIPARAAEVVPFSKRQIDAYQAAVLALLAHQYDRPGAEFLEIGTALGYSAAVLALAAPRAEVVTLNPKAREYLLAVENLEALGNVLVLPERSDNYLAELDGSIEPASPLDLVFVDGSHLYEAVKADCGFWRHVRPGGLILFHDYSPAHSGRPSPDVMRVADEFGAELGWGPDVLVVDHRRVGMAGWYRGKADGDF